VHAQYESISFSSKYPSFFDSMNRYEYATVYIASTVDQPTNLPQYCLMLNWYSWGLFTLLTISLRLPGDIIPDKQPDACYGKAPSQCN